MGLQVLVHTKRVGWFGEPCRGQNVEDVVITKGGWWCREKKGNLNFAEFWPLVKHCLDELSYLKGHSEVSVGYLMAARPSVQAFLQGKDRVPQGGRTAESTLKVFPVPRLEVREGGSQLQTWGQEWEPGGRSCEWPPGEGRWELLSPSLPAPRALLVIKMGRWTM